MILSAGSGARFSGELPKQYHTLAGKEILEYSIMAMRASKRTDAVLIVAGEDDVKRLHTRYGDVCECIQGGQTRNASLKLGLDYIKSRYNCANVLINEAARPFLTAELVDEYFAYLAQYDAVITAQHITDSLGRFGEAVTDRSQYYLIQAPEAFRFDLLYTCFDADSNITATAQQLPPESNVLKYFDYKRNLKITYPQDLIFAELLMRECEAKVYG